MARAKTPSAFCPMSYGKHAETYFLTFDVAYSKGRKKEIHICFSRLGLIKMDHHHHQGRAELGI
jgi:hypothetical protein